MKFSSDTCILSDCGGEAVVSLGHGVLLCQTHIDRLDSPPAHLQMIEAEVEGEAA